MHRQARQLLDTDETSARPPPVKDACAGNLRWQANYEAAVYALRRQRTLRQPPGQARGDTRSKRSPPSAAERSGASLVLFVPGHLGIVQVRRVYG